MNKDDAIGFIRDFQADNKLSDSKIGHWLAGENYYLDKWMTDYLQDSLDYKIIEKDGGGEGGTEYCYVVFTIHGVLYRMEFSYASYEGYSFYNPLQWSEVKPVQKVITVYEDI